MNSEPVNRRTCIAIVERKETIEHIMIYKTLHRKLKIMHLEHHKKSGVNLGESEG
jgi:hypothetical protein